MKTISIMRQDAIIEVTTRRAKINITTPPPKMTVRTTRPRMNIERQGPKLRPNWGNVLRQPMRPMRTHQPVRITRFEPIEIQKLDIGQGDFSATVSLSAASRIRANHLQEGQNHLTPVEQAQSVRSAAMEWDMGSMQINWELSKMDVSWDISNPKIEVEPHEIEIKMKRYPRLIISLNPEVERRGGGGKFERNA